MKFKNVIREANVDTGNVGEITEPEKKKEKKKRKKRVFGSWFTSHNNSKHLNK